MMLSTTTGQVGGVQEDALLTIGVLVEGEGRGREDAVSAIGRGGGGGVDNDVGEYITVFYCIAAQTVGFVKYMDLFHPYLSAALKNYTDIQVPNTGCPPHGVIIISTGLPSCRGFSGGLVSWVGGSVAEILH